MSLAPISSATAAAVPSDDPLRRSLPARTRSAAPFNAAALKHAPVAEQRRAVAAQFEAVLVRQLLGKTMTAMLGGSGSGAAGSIYGDLLADTLSQQLTAGQGMGLSRFLEKQLTPKGEAAAPAPAAAPHAP